MYVGSENASEVYEYIISMLMDAYVIIENSRACAVSRIGAVNAMALASYNSFYRSPLLGREFLNDGGDSVTE